MIRLDLNERSRPLDPPIMAAILEAWRDLDVRRYPPEGGRDLAADLSRAYGFPQDRIFVGAGADDVLHALTLAAARRVRKAIIPVPTFGMYRHMAAAARLTVVEVPVEPGSGRLPAGALLAPAQDGPVLLFICQPNNPTGDLWGLDELNQVADGLPEGSLLILDEAYWEYAGEDGSRWAAERPGVALVRTFSKAMGLAGLRCGYGVVPADWSDDVAQVAMPFNVSGPALEAARLVLARREQLEQEALTVARLRDEIRARLQEAGLPGVHVYPSRANFLLLALDGGPARAQEAASRLAARGIRVRTYPEDPRLAHCMRVSIGTPEEMDTWFRAFLETLPAPAADRERRGRP